jgi:hypothetical protein
MSDEQEPRLQQSSTSPNNAPSSSNPKNIHQPNIQPQKVVFTPEDRSTAQFSAPDGERRLDL